jgi:demethylmenaquinone methyltransferase/2-methoxy-6-polyprenyl-1,4-benzoquinol methylase
MLPNDLDPTRLQQIYDNTAAFYDDVVAAHQAHAKQLAIEALDRRAGERFLEVGVGTGWAFNRVIARGAAANAVGLDFAPGMLEVARARLALDRPSLVLADARQLPFSNATFDCLLSTHTLEVLPAADIAAVLRECHRVLKPGGRLVLVNLTDGEGEDESISEAWKQGYAADPEYYSGARPVQLSAAVREAGFRDVVRRYSGHGKGWPSEIITAIR